MEAGFQSWVGEYWKKFVPYDMKGITSFDDTSSKQKMLNYIFDQHILELIYRYLQ